MLYNFNPLPPDANWADILLTEWEQFAQPAPTAEYRYTRSQFLTQFQLFDAIVQPMTDVNIDLNDVRTVLR